MHEVAISDVVTVLLSSHLFFRIGVVLLLLGLARAGAKLTTAGTRRMVDLSSAGLILIGVAIVGLGIGWWLADRGLIHWFQVWQVLASGLAGPGMRSSASDTLDHGHRFLDHFR